MAAVRTAVLDPAALGAVVGGPGGVGKSRLLHEFAATVDTPVLEARAGQAPALRFGAFAHLLPIRTPVREVAGAVAALLSRAGEGAFTVVADDVHDLDGDSALLLAELAKTGRMRLVAAGSALPAPLDGLALVPVELRPLTGLAALAEVDDPTAEYLAEATGGDLRLLHELLRAGRATGVLDGGQWKEVPARSGDGPASLEEAIARAALLAALDSPEEAEQTLADAPRRPEDKARSVLACARAAVLAYGLGRAEDADRVLSVALETVGMPAARQRLLAQRAAFAVHRAESRAAFDLADDAAELADADPGIRARIDTVEAVTAALTGQATAALDKVRSGLRLSDGWLEHAPESGPLLEFARSWVWITVGDLDAAAEHVEPSDDPVARAATRARVLRGRGQVHAALREGWDGARLLDRGKSLFAGPCLGELAHAAALAGDLATARHALAEADRRALPTLRALWFPVALARPWLLVAQGAVGAAVHGLLDAAAAAEALELRPYALTALHDVVRLGAAGVVADRLAHLAEDAEGDLAALCARHAEAAAAGDWSGLIGVSLEFEDLGMTLHAAEAAAQAAEVHWDKQQAAAAGTRAWVLVQRSDQVRTPALRTAAVPDLTRIQYEIAELIAAGRTEPEIAEQMSLAARTVTEQTVEICAKLGVSGPERLAVLLAPPV
ncbi:LuxR C-terminal-related transcriptional regulator [Actinocorallia sp. API 0066]|uniref:LuxR C-terminal-related transcriptional regulator n=1 Tax=Actinocorallia sp. API 0066 TaxID=2896846 RepID=UPI001E48786F|nr:LuxR C-terminal-related transcriptional regulator [Actinocorallia sp. API 0066]MCD0448303.1 LuxR C-terminal-related transcriptional regulator [Actinocorallia sp. API 0066]